MKKVLISVRPCGHVESVTGAPTIIEEIPEEFLGDLCDGYTLRIVDLDYFKNVLAPTMLCDCLKPA